MKKASKSVFAAVAALAVSLTASGVPKEYTGATGGSWDDAANWTPAGVPTASDDVTIGAKTVNAINIVANTLYLSGATLNVGDSSSRPAVSVAVADDVTLSGSSRLYVYAPELADDSIYETCYSNYSTLYPVLWNAAVRVDIGGDFSVSDTSVVYPDASPITGVPVFFKVAGDFSLAEGASFNVVHKGWGWSLGAWADAPAGAKPRKKEAQSPESSGWTFAPGAGLSWSGSARYGGTAGSSTWQSKPYGASYGYAYAPFLSGSPGGYYQDLDFTRHRGNGSIVVFTKGTATVNGSLIAGDQPKCDHSGDSGGGVWLTAEEFSFGANASVVAIGRDTNGPYAVGGGGRVAFAEGLTDDADIASFAAGTLPDGYTPTEIVDEVSVDVRGGSKSGDSWGTTGTAKYIRSDSIKVKVSVTFDGSGSVNFNGTVYDSDFEIMVDPNTDIPVTAMPATDWRFNYWIGDALQGGGSDQPSITLNTSIPTALTVEFLTGVAPKNWIGAANASWDSPASWSPAGVPGQYDAVYMTNAIATLTHAAHLGKLVIAGNSKITLAAPALTGNSDFTNLYASAMVVMVDDLTEVSGTATLTFRNDGQTGNPVRLATGTFTLGANAKISADGGGWGWISGVDEYSVASSGSNSTRAPGAGSSYTEGASYGGRGNGNASRGPYGYKYAPFMPGSPNGCYNKKLENCKNGGGTIWIDCSGTATINGMITATGSSAAYGSPSGGGIWILASGIEAAPSGSITSEGGFLSSENGYGSMGAGGRVSLGIGLTAAEKAALAAGEEPAGLRYYDVIDLLSASAPGGRENRKGTYRGKPGTCTTVVGNAGECEVCVNSIHDELSGTEPAFGLHSYPIGGTTTFTASQYGFDSSSLVRYSCAGYVVSNALGEVASGNGSSVSVSMANGPVYVTWIWENREAKITVAKPANAAISIGGAAQAGDVETWYAGTSQSIGVVPDAGYEFVSWAGALPKDCWTANPLVVTGALPADITPVIRKIEEPMTREWNATGDWTDPSKWTPAGNIPGALDTVIIKGKTCTIADYAVCSNIVVEGGTLNVGAAVNMANHPKLAVTHDFTATNSAAINVYGGPVEEDYSFANGTAFVAVGGTLLLTGSSVCRPYSQYLNGGSPVFYADTFVVTTNATVNANEKGYFWNGSVSPDTPGLGFSYTGGAAYGNAGAGGGGGQAYGFAYSPVHPGSPNGSYSNGQNKPGGLIRVHARTMSIAGKLLANAFVTSTFGGPSGGGIWLTANSFDFVPGSVFSAKGGNSDYGSYGTGGRIAFTLRPSARQLADLAETGTTAIIKPSRIASLADFLSAHPGVSVEVVGGCFKTSTTPSGPVGTFNFVDAGAWGTRFIVR